MKYKKIIAGIVLTLFVAGTFLPTFAAAPPTVTTHNFEISIDVNDFAENYYELQQNNELKIEENSDFSLFGQNDNVAITPVSPDNYYGRQALAKTERGVIRTTIYDSIVFAVENEMEQAEFRNIEAQVTKEDCDVAWNAVIYDYPQLFYYNSYGMRYQYEGIISGGVIPEENRDYVALMISYHTFSDLEREKAEFEETADYIIESAGITSADSDYEKAKKLHDTLIGWVEYDHKAAEENSSNSLSHTAYNAIVKHSAVCDGYARAYQYLLYKVGILSHIITGYGQSGTSPENHAWNMVWLDEKPYYTDVTWDDMQMGNSKIGYTNVGISYRYFNINDGILEKDHYVNQMIDHNNGNAIVAESLGYELPVCTATENWYYSREGIVLTAENKNDEETINKVATLLAYDVKARIFIDDDISFGEWWSNNGYNIFLAYKDKTSCTDIPQVGYTLSDNEYSLFFLESGTIKANDNYELIMYHNKDHSGKLCQMVYDESGVGSYCDMIDIGVSSGDEIISLMMYPWKKNLKCKNARYMFIDFDNNFRPLMKKYDIEF